MLRTDCVDPDHDVCSPISLTPLTRWNEDPEKLD